MLRAPHEVVKNKWLRFHWTPHVDMVYFVPLVTSRDPLVILNMLAEEETIVCISRVS
jgi:hypothetical protein